MDFYANLHSHSTHSDGVYTPRELARIAKAEGYSAIAITDHDTASAFPELKEACGELGLECIFGVEFTVVKPKAYHIIGFNFDPKHPDMKDYLEKMAIRQTDNTRLCFEAALERGDITGVSWEDVLEYNKGIPWICNNHVFRLLKSRGLEKQENYIAWYNKNFHKQRTTYPPMHSFLPLRELVALIKSAGGFAIVAHPNGQLDDLDMLMEAGIEGLEVWHNRLSPKEKERALSLAMKHKLFVSGGSDHTGLLGGHYESFTSEDELKSSYYYIEPHSVGTTREFYEEIRAHKINRNAVL